MGLNGPQAAEPAPSGVVSSSLWRIGSRVISSVIFGLTLLLLARISPVADFGEFMVAGSIALVTGIVFGFGAPSRVLRSAAEGNGPGVVRALFLLYLGVNVAIAAGMLGVAAFAGLGWTVSAGMMWGLGDTLQTYAQNHYAGIARHRISSWLVATQRIAPFAIVVAFLVSGRSADYRLLTVGFAVSVLVGAVAPAFAIRGARGDFRAVTRGVFGWWGFSLSNILYQLQAPVVAAAASTTVAGLYAVASKVIGPILLLPAAMATVIIPELARRVGTDGFWDLYRKFSRLCLVYAAAAVVCAWPVAILVIEIVGEDYAAAKPVVAGMVAAAGLSAYTQAFVSLLVAVDRPAGATVSITAGGIAALVLLAVLGRWAPIESLALVQIAAETVVLGGMIIAVRRFRAARVIS